MYSFFLLIKIFTQFFIGFSGYGKPVSFFAGNVSEKNTSSPIVAYFNK